MLKLEHISIKDERGQLILKDVSFELPNFGFIAIHGDSTLMHHALAQVLAGIQKPEEGTLLYNDTKIINFDEGERSRYRSVFVSSLFHDFQMLKTRSVYENITMGLEYPQERVEQELKKWKLFDKRDISAEDLSTQEQWKMVLIRCVLRQPMMLVFDSESCPLSPLECKNFYTLLQELRTTMLIVVIGDEGSYSFATRIIEFAEGYRLSDSLREEEVVYPQINHSADTFELTRADVEELHTTIHTFIRWKLRCASILCVAAFIALSTAIFSTTLNITDIQMRLMKKQGSSMIAIEKQAISNDGNVIENYYDYLRNDDIAILSKELNGDLIYGYYPTDENMAKLYTYGMVYGKQDTKNLDNDTIIEADSEEELGIHTIYGTYPQNYYQIALSSYQAYELLEDRMIEPYRNTEDQIEQMLGMSVSWYGQDLIISGIFPSQNEENRNMDLDMTGYNGSTYASGTMMEKSFFVRKGFHEAYPILQMNVFQKSNKRMVSGSKVIGSMEGIYPLETDVYYYDGKEYQRNHELEEDEILIDFSMALAMGFQTIYQNYEGSEYATMDEMQTSYEAFAKQWINSVVSIQAYTVDDAPTSSSLMSKKVKIKGFVFPMIYRYNGIETYQNDAGSIYVNPKLSEPYESKNTFIKEAFYHSEKEEDIKQALSYLNGSKDYAAYLMNSRILKFFVVDLKEITSFLMIFGGVSFAVFIAILCFLLSQTYQHMRSECTIFYLFGERRSTLKKMLGQYFQMILWMRSLFGWLCGTLALATFILMIYFALSASSSIVFSLALPLLLLLGSVVIVKIVFYIIMRKTRVIEEEFQDV